MSSGSVRLAVASGKGGTGKTTVAVNLAVTLARQGLTVAYVDCDVDASNLDHAHAGDGECHP
ncbi:MAG TPA: ParA family protein [Verrucomicrobiota bacterium]|nr:ParA family protein [Verrucomicrobiota bacterium]HRZ38915.1 ParA family protein [Candidatus Paceibacterota bacterium]HRZ58844.1 ParA family protein [Candidatus Paceibacterota bacterium]